MLDGVGQTSAEYPLLPQFNAEFRSAISKYVDSRLDELEQIAFDNPQSNNVDLDNKNYDMPPQQFLQLLDYIEHLLVCRDEFFSFETDLNFKEDIINQDKFKSMLVEMLNIFDSADSFLANTNDGDFLANVSYLIDTEWESLNAYINRNDMWGENPDFETHRTLRNRMYTMLRGNNVRISDLIRSNGFTVTVTPYHINLDLTCNAIAEKLKALEPELNKRGFYFDKKFFYILEQGPSHEKAHHEAYINYRPEQAESRRSMLIEGRSRLSEWINFSTELKIRRQGNTIVAGMTAVVPHTDSLDEFIHVHLAPEQPSLGDVLLTAKAIFESLPPESELYQRILESIADVCEELHIFSPDENIPELLIERMTNFYHGEYFIINTLYRHIKPIDDLFASHLVQIVRNHQGEYSKV